VTAFLWLATSGEGGGWIGRWSPGIGDPTLSGWLATLAYFAAAWCCLDAARRIRPELLRAPTLRRERSIWRALAALLAALGVNKQLDLQSALTELARIAARSGGWYAQRRGLQLAFVGAVALAGLAAIASAFWLSRRTRPAVRLGVVAFTALVAFVVARAASFHRVDIAISQEWMGLRVSSLIEVAALLVVIAAARWQRRALGG
jgi:hypothetical protein